MTNGKNKYCIQQRIYIIRAFVVIQAFCPAQTPVLVERQVARNLLRDIASTGMCNHV